MTEIEPRSPERPWRLFIGVPMPVETARHLDAALVPYRARFPAARWQRPEAFHVTLRFLGATPAERVAALAAGMARCGATGRPFRLASDGSDGVVRRSGGVAWLRIGPGRSQVESLARCLFVASQDGDLPGIAAAAAAPAPHVTIARRADRELIDALASRSLGDIAVEWQVDRLVLYRSHTGTPAGSSYEPLAEVRL